jgi:SAM-dependent methyltransferase
MLRERIMMHSRKRKLAHFFSLCPAGSKVLDAGVTGSWKRDERALNYFAAHYPYDSSTYTGLGITDMSMVKQKYPDKRFVRYDGKTMPFADDTFDWVFSNAVIEHVGDEDDQINFLREMLRVGRNVFFTTPNRFFPVETHTQELFVHWRRDWRPKRTLPIRLLSYLELSDIAKRAGASFAIRRNRLLGWTMTFSVVATRARASRP